VGPAEDRQGGPVGLETPGSAGYSKGGEEMNEDQSMLLPDLARGRADSNRRAADLLDAEARHLTELRRLHAELGTLRRRVARNAREALRYTLLELGESRHVWQEVRALFEEGLEGHEARRAIQAAVDYFDSWLGLEKSTRELWRIAEQAGATPEGLEQLDAASREAGALRAAAEKLRDFLTRPPSPVDPAVIERARQAIARGEYKDADAVRASLRGQG
jgi:hypothetical protein